LIGKQSVGFARFTGMFDPLPCCNRIVVIEVIVYSLLRRSASRPFEYLHFQKTTNRTKKTSNSTNNLKATFLWSRRLCQVFPTFKRPEEGPKPIKKGSNGVNTCSEVLRSQSARPNGLRCVRYIFCIHISDIQC
jgi:hypothetical protein